MILTPLRLRNFPYLVALVTVVLGVFLEAQGARLAGPYLPLGWGLIKDLTDPIIIVLFPWNGWVFFLPLCLALFFAWGWLEVTVLWFIVSLTMGVGDTFVSFDQWTIVRCVKGVAFYMAIFGVELLVGIFFYWTIRGGIKWHQ